MKSFLLEVRDAGRGLRRSPGFLLTVLLTLGLGLGSTLALFAAIEAYLLAPLPYAGADRLVALWETKGDDQPVPISRVTLEDWRSGAEGLESAAAFRLRTFLLEGDGSQEVVRVGMVTPDFFRVLAVVPEAGRPLSAEDATPGREHVVWLTHGLWARRFGREPAAVGRTLTLNEVPYVIAGVLPSSFAYPMEDGVPDLYIPLPAGWGGGSRAGRSLHAIARLRPGVDLERARLELKTLAARLAEVHPDTSAGHGATVQPLHEQLAGTRHEPLLLLMVSAAMLLVITCANIANLLIARTATRMRELALRESLGATRGDLLRQFLAEALLLSAGGTVVGLGIARGVLALLARVPQLLPAGNGLAQLRPPALDGSTLGVGVGLAVLTTVSFGLIPPLVLRRFSPLGALRDGGSGATTGAGRRFRAALIVAEVALSVVLLVNCGLLLRGFLGVVSTSPGFDTAQVLTFGMGLPDTRYGNDARRLTFHEALLGRLSGLPGVQGVGGIWTLPMASRRRPSWYEPGSVRLPPDERPTALVSIVSPGALEVLDVPLLAGRRFTWRDRLGQPPVVLVNASLARRLGGTGAVGQRLRLSWNSDSYPAGTEWEVVGLVGDMRQVSLEEAPLPQLFVPLGQMPPDGISYTLRTSLPASSLAEAVRDAVRAVDGQLQDVVLEPLSAVVVRSLAERRATLGVVLALAAAALFLTGFGLYGVIACILAEQSRELAIRVAVGASARQILALVLRRALWAVGVGAVLGLGLAWATAQVFASQWVGLSAEDPLTFCVATALIVLTALCVSLRPALRAARVVPNRLLRAS